MDVLSAVLSELDVRGSVFCYGPVGGSWGLEGGAEGVVLFHALVEGEAWATVGDGPPQRLESGDVMLLTRGRRHTLGARKGTATVPLRQAVRRDAATPFARLALEGTGNEAWLVCGSLVVDGLATHPLLRTLPDVVVANTGAARWLRDTVSALARQLSAESPGSALTASRLAEVLFVQAIGAWLQEQDPLQGWAAATRDPHVGRALVLLHADPGQAWTAEGLARAVGVSRSVLFERFSRLLGQPPMRWLAQLRMERAATALARSGRSIGEVSEAAGYGSVPAFTKAFRRHHGQTPAAWRRAQRTPEPSRSSALG